MLQENEKVKEEKAMSIKKQQKDNHCFGVITSFFCLPPSNQEVCAYYQKNKKNQCKFCFSTKNKKGRLLCNNVTAMETTLAKIYTNVIIKINKR